MSLIVRLINTHQSTRVRLLSRNSVLWWVLPSLAMQHMLLSFYPEEAASRRRESNSAAAEPKDLAPQARCLQAKFIMFGKNEGIGAKII